MPVPHFEEQYLERPLPPQREIVGAAAAAERSSIEQFEREGFLVIRNFLTPEKVAASKERLQHILDNWQQGRQPGKGSPDEAPITPLVDLDQDFRTGKLPMPAETIDATRRFFRMAVHDTFFREMTMSPTLVDPLKALWGEDVALLQSMALLKPPGTGEKRWHADQGYFRLHRAAKPGSEVAAFWIALDPCDAKNGCMYVAPRTHTAGTPSHAIPTETLDGRPMSEHTHGHIFYSASDAPPIGNVHPVSMQPGDALLFHGNVLHFTPPNRTQTRRRALQFHYAAGDCKPTACPNVAGARKKGAPNEVYGPAPDAGEGLGGFDCAPQDGICIEPQYWYYRRAEIIAAGKQTPGCI